MPHRLSGPFPAVHHHSVPGAVKPVLARQAIGKLDGLAHEGSLCFGNISQRRNVFGRKNQQMRGRLRMDVFHSHKSFAFSHNVRRNAALNDPTEQTLGLRHASGLSSAVCSATSQLSTRPLVTMRQASPSPFLALALPSRLFRFPSPSSVACKNTCRSDNTTAYDSAAYRTRRMQPPESQYSCPSPQCMGQIPPMTARTLRRRSMACSTLCQSVACVKMAPIIISNTLLVEPPLL